MKNNNDTLQLIKELYKIGIIGNKKKSRRRRSKRNNIQKYKVPYNPGEYVPGAQRSIPPNVYQPFNRNPHLQLQDEQAAINLEISKSHLNKQNYPTISNVETPRFELPDNVQRSIADMTTNYNTLSESVGRLNNNQQGMYKIYETQIEPMISNRSTFMSQNSEKNVKKTTPVQEVQQPIQEEYKNENIEFIPEQQPTINPVVYETSQIGGKKINVNKPSIMSNTQVLINEYKSLGGKASGNIKSLRTPAEIKEMIEILKHYKEVNESIPEEMLKTSTLKKLRSYQASVVQEPEPDVSDVEKDKLIHEYHDLGGKADILTLSLDEINEMIVILRSINSYKKKGHTLSNIDAFNNANTLAKLSDVYETMTEPEPTAHKVTKRIKKVVKS